MKPNYILFTDGSVRRWKDPITKEQLTAGSYGIVVLDIATMRYTEFGSRLKTSSSIYAEAWAMYRGLQYINGICVRRRVKASILLVTDNKINVEILTKYVKGSWDMSDWNHWKKSDKSPVKNQELYRDILTLIGSNNIQLKVVHINSHLPSGSAEVIQEKLRKFGVTVNVDTANLFQEMNERADKVATDITTSEMMHIKSEKYGSRKKLVWEPVRKIVS